MRYRSYLVGFYGFIRGLTVFFADAGDLLVVLWVITFSSSTIGSFPSPGIDMVAVSFAGDSGAEVAVASPI